MKTLRNLFLVLALTCSYAMADDGHTGTGNRCDTCPPCTENCVDGGGESAGSAEFTLNEGGTEDLATSEDWSEWFFQLIGYGEF